MQDIILISGGTQQIGMGGEHLNILFGLFCFIFKKFDTYLRMELIVLLRDLRV